jgi:hypothetical protein
MMKQPDVVATMLSEEMNGIPHAVSMFGRLVELDDNSRGVLEAFGARMAVERELKARQEPLHELPVRVEDAPALLSWEDAIKRYSPRQTLGSPDGEVAQAIFDDSSTLLGRSIVLKGILSKSVSANRKILLVGRRELFLDLPASFAQSHELSEGARVEVLAVGLGSIQDGSSERPLFDVKWMRVAFSR